MDNIKNTLCSMFKALFNPDNKLSLIPNWLSFSRAIGGPLIPFLTYSGAGFEVVFFTVLLVGLSDFLDGKVARLLVKEETKDGAMLDAISDKIFSISLMLGLLPVVPSMACNLIFEGATSVINGKILASGRTPKSSFIGKFKTWPLFISLGLAYTGLSFNGSVLGITASDFINTAGMFSIASIPLEALSTKKYLTEYLKPSSEKVMEETPVLDNLEEEKNDELHTEKKISYVLDKGDKNAVIVFEPEYQEEIDLSSEKGKQKRLEL